MQNIPNLGVFLILKFQIKDTQLVTVTKTEEYGQDREMTQKWEFINTGPGLFCI